MESHKHFHMLQNREIDELYINLGLRACTWSDFCCSWKFPDDILIEIRLNGVGATGRVLEKDY